MKALAGPFRLALSEAAEDHALPNIEIYTTPLCPYCHAAKRLLDQKGVRYVETNVLMKPELRKQMVDRSGGRTTVPQIFIDGRHIGGCDDLHALDGKGGLDPLLAAGATAGTA